MATRCCLCPTLLPCSCAFACLSRCWRGLVVRITTCGAHVDVYGDHLLSCPNFLTNSIPGHDLVQEAVASMCSCANVCVSHDARRPRAVSLPYSPMWRSDLTLLHGSETGSHVIIDVTGTSVVAQQSLPGSDRPPQLASRGTAGRKCGVYGTYEWHTTTAVTAPPPWTAPPP